MAVGYSMASNIKISTTHTCKASDLIAFREEIATIITSNKVISVLPDEDHYRVKINKIPTWYNPEHPMTISQVHQELTAYVPEYDKMKKWRTCPIVIGRSEEHTSELQSHSDLVCRLLLEKKKHKQKKA